MIDLQGIEIRYGARIVLDSISFSSKKGEFLGIIGPNGSGKTTLLKAISKVVEPSAGVISLEGRSISDLGPREISRAIGVVPQAMGSGFDFSVRDVVMMGRFPHTGRFGSEKTDDYEICRKAMDITGVTELADRSVRAISGGELQRVIIARALAQQPRLLLLDEPTSHLDLGHQIDILQTIRRMSREIAVIGVFHDLNYASHYCDRLVLLHDHRILVMGTPEEVLTPENIRIAFGIEVNVRVNTSTGRPFITPVYSPETSPGCRDIRVHVICGGGTGSTILHALYNAGCRVTTGVLSMNDSDYETALQLGIPCIVEPPFSPISAGSRSLLEEELKNSDIVVITGMPVGAGNLDNLRAVEVAGDIPLLFLTESGTFGIDDFARGEAVSILERLIGSGRLTVLSRNRVIQECTGLHRRG